MLRTTRRARADDARAMRTSNPFPRNALARGLFSSDAAQAYPEVSTRFARFTAARVWIA